jgi:hypothetical protein
VRPGGGIAARLIAESSTTKHKRYPNMTLIDIILVLIVVGLVLWLINTYVPMAAAIKSLLNIVVFVVVLVWVLQVFGLITQIPFHIPPLR